MLPRSYAGEEESSCPKWLLFAREERDDTLVFTVVVTLQSRHAVAELRVDAAALTRHSEELGLEMQADAFKTLLYKALEQRECVDVELEAEDDAVTQVFLSLTYKFSPTISRRGIFQLPIMATDAPQSLVTLLASVHASPPLSMLSEQQRRKKEQLEHKQKTMAAAAKLSADQNSSSSIATQEVKGVTAAASQSSDNATATPAVNPMVLKRRHVPTGTMRRKGPRGAKLAKK
ncbi:Tail-anchored protein insertion receptor WRB [Phytophthora cinnamomi]|uniref:Tail-anchored protein insertion receptor WRB n=1 Tax=Phytophthora cinnamomi TaxID=4785 RepID=UPI00355ABB41|nr:Tail-anchored protein insertion receptor WRB [Phytophthora cinnamomi]